MAVSVDFKCTKMPEFAGEKQVRARPIDKIDQRAAVLHQCGIEIALARRKSPYVFCERAIHTKGSIELQLAGSFEFQLAPSSHGIERANQRGGIHRHGCEQKAPADA